MAKFLNTMSRKTAFFLGVALTFDVTGSVSAAITNAYSEKSVRSSVGAASDAARLKADWENIGNDFRFAMRSANEH